MVLQKNFYCGNFNSITIILPFMSWFFVSVKFCNATFYFLFKLARCPSNCHTTTFPFIIFQSRMPPNQNVSIAHQKSKKNRNKGGHGQLKHHFELFWKKLVTDIVGNICKISFKFKKLSLLFSLSCNSTF